MASTIYEIEDLLGKEVIDFEKYELLFRKHENKVFGLKLLYKNSHGEKSIRYLTKDNIRFYVFQFIIHLILHI